MPDLFFYGTLRYAPLLALALGRPASELDMTPASLADHTVRAASAQTAPTLLRAQGASAEGILVRGVSAEELERLAFYCCGSDCSLQSRWLDLPDGSQAEASVVLVQRNISEATDAWSFDNWIKQWGQIELYAAEEVMAHYGRADVETIAQSLPAIRVRAWARIAAEDRGTGDTRDLHRDVIEQRRTRAYLDYFGMDEVELRHRQHDGSMGPLLSRNGLMTGQAAVVLPYDPRRDCVLLIEQFRAPVYLIGDPEPWVWEAVAGMVDPGEAPETTARREALEEAHVELQGTEFAGGAYSSTGSSTEYIHLYVGLADLVDTVENGGLETEGEDIRSRILPFDAFMDLVDCHRIKNLQLLSLAHWLHRHRPRLRGAV